MELTGATAKAAEALRASEKTWSDKVAGLEAELKKSQPDAIKTVYEARLAEMKSQLDAKDKSLADATAAHEKMLAHLTIT